MAEPTMRRLSALLLVSLALAIVSPLVPPARAQESNGVRLVLLMQTPSNSVSQPRLVVEVRAENEGDQPLGDLSIGATLFGPVFSRTEYESSLLADPSTGVLSAGTFPHPGTLNPGTSRVFRVELDLSALSGLSYSQSLIYPLKIDLRTGFTSLAAIRTPVVFIVRKPVVPLALTLTFVLSTPVDRRPDGVFESTALEQAIGHGGRLAEEIHALARLVAQPEPAALDVVVSPMLLVQLARMRNGYSVLDGGRVREVKAGEGGSAAAAQMLTELKRVAASGAVQLLALPFSEPDLPALVAAGLASDLERQLDLGAQTVQMILGRTPDGTVLRPPDSALDQASLDELPAGRVKLLLLDTSAVPLPEQPKGFAPPPTVSLTTGGGSTVVALVSDPNVQALLASSLATSGGRLAAQAVLGELAAIWLQAPGEARGIALTFPETLSAAPGTFFGPLVRAIAQAPWLHTRTASALAVTFPPTTAGRLSISKDEAFPTGYADRLERARRQVGTYRSMLVDGSDAADRLDTQLLTAESGRFVQDPAAGEAFIASVLDKVDATFEAVRPDARQTITLTANSQKGVPIRVTNGNGEPLRVTVQLVSPHLRASPPKSVVLPPRQTETVSFDIELKTTGRFPAQVQVLSPSGHLIGQTTLIVRSTALNSIALVITVGAAILALLVWARRFLPRRTS
jgi:hypothetical protein